MSIATEARSTVEAPHQKRRIVRDLRDRLRARKIRLQAREDDKEGKLPKVQIVDRIHGTPLVDVQRLYIDERLAAAGVKPKERQRVRVIVETDRMTSPNRPLKPVRHAGEHDIALHGKVGEAVGFFFERLSHKVGAIKDEGIPTALQHVKQKGPVESAKDILSIVRGKEIEVKDDPKSPVVEKGKPGSDVKVSYAIRRRVAFPNPNLFSVGEGNLRLFAPKENVLRIRIQGEPSQELVNDKVNRGILEMGESMKNLRISKWGVSTAISTPITMGAKAFAEANWAVAAKIAALPALLKIPAIAALPVIGAVTLPIIGGAAVPFGLAYIVLIPGLIPVGMFLTPRIWQGIKRLFGVTQEQQRRYYAYDKLRGNPPVTLR